MHPENFIHPWWYGTSAFLVKNGEYIKIGDSIPNFNDIVYEKENKTMEKVTRNDRINGKTIKHSVKDGMQVVLRNGDICIVDTLSDGEMYLINKKRPIRLSCYDDTMNGPHYTGEPIHDVMKIYSRPNLFVGCLDDLLVEGYGRKLIWERDEATPMTQEQIEAALGYKVKIKEV